MTAWNAMVRLLTLRCEEAAEIASRELDESLGWVDRWAAGGHRLVCRSCRRFYTQLSMIRVASQSLSESSITSEQSQDSLGLSRAAKARIAQALREAELSDVDPEVNNHPEIPH